MSEKQESVPQLQRPATSGRWRLARWGGGAVIACGLLIVAANVSIRLSVGPYLHAAPGDVRAPVAIVPGASVHRDGTPSPQLEGRLAAALALVRTGRVEQVLVSGARNGAYDEAGPMRRWLIQRGVPPERVLDDHAGFRTLDTMQRAARVFAVHQAVVCTQSFHLPRAVFLARRAGIEAVGLAADRYIPARSAGDVVREAVANLLAIVDSYVLNRQPRDPGPSPARDG